MQHDTLLLTAQEHSCQSEGKRGERNTIVIYFASMLAKHDDDDDDDDNYSR